MDARTAERWGLVNRANHIPFFIAGYGPMAAMLKRLFGKD